MSPDRQVKTSALTPRTIQTDSRSWYDVLKRVHFEQTRIGLLPGEVRELIYECVLIVPLSQLPIILRPPTWRGVDLSEDPELCGESSEFRKPMVTYAALTQVCRKIHQEANHIFFAKNSFRCKSILNLRRFLESIGSNHLNELTSLHMDSILSLGLKWKNKESLDRFCNRANILPGVKREIMAFDTQWQLGQDAIDVQELLGECTNLRKVCFGIQDYGDLVIARWITDIPGYRNNAAIDFVDATHWAMRRVDCARDWRWTMEIRCIENGFPKILKGKGHRVIEVDFTMVNKDVLTLEGDLKDDMKDGLGVV